MKKMDEIDGLITEALSREEKFMYSELDEPSVAEMVTELFAGRHRWLNLMTVPVTLGFLIFAVYGGWRFYEATTVREMLLWGGGALFACLAILAMKVWAWMEIQRNALTREIKRVELQLAHLSGKLDDR